MTNEANPKDLHRQQLELGAIAAIANAATHSPDTAPAIGAAVRKAIDSLLNETTQSE